MFIHLQQVTSHLSGWIKDQLETPFGLEAAKGAPAVVGATATAMTLNQWIGVGTGIYIAIQALYLLRKWYREEKTSGGWFAPSKFRGTAKASSKKA